ncbi:MAG: YceI family protein [Candidatus Acidiferrales bacterium]
MKINRARIVGVLLLAAFHSVAIAAAPKSQAKTYRISKTYTTLSFTATKWMVFKEEGIFQEFSGTLTYDAANPAASAIDVIVQAASLDTRNSARDGVLRSDDFFDVARYPTLTFRSVAVTAAGKDTLNVMGDLTIRGVTHRITIPVHIIGVRAMPGIGEFAGFETNFVIDRRDYSVLGSRWSGGKLAIDYAVPIHLIIGGVREER